MRKSNWQAGILRAIGVLTLGLVIELVPGARLARAICGDGGGPICAGDCDGNGSATVDEIVTMVNAALNGGDGGCPAGDSDNSGSITVDEIVTAVNVALNGCSGAASLDRNEECDDGGLCVGGADAGEPCTAENECEGDGACCGGLDDLRGCRSDANCREGTCRKCRPYGGDGCAANCTFETDNDYALVPGQVEPGGVLITPGTSGAIVFGAFLSSPLPFWGNMVLTKGKIVDGEAPVVLKNVRLSPVPLGLACTCVRVPVGHSCGGTLYDADGAQSPNCTPGFMGIVPCPAGKKCAAVHGPGNSGSGLIACGADRIYVDVTQNCNAISGELPFDPAVIVDRVPIPIPADKGSAFLNATAAIGIVVAGCSGGLVEHGPDGRFCTDDDPLSNRGTPVSIPFTTGTATGTVFDPGDFEDTLGPFSTTGAPFSCNGDTVGVQGTNLAGVLTACDQPAVNDVVLPINFVAE